MLLQECKELGFGTIETLFSVKFDNSDIPASGDRAFGAYIAPVKQSSGNQKHYLCSLY
jgi:hypothetical protein